MGAGVFRRYVGPELAPVMVRTLKLGAWVGAGVLAVASLGDLAWNVTRLLGRWDASFVGEYTLYTRHGRTTLIRLGLTGTLLAVSLKSVLLKPASLKPASLKPVSLRPVRFSRWLLAALGLGLLATFSFLSHAATMHGPPALLADLVHFTAATLWGGAVLYTALSPAWRHEPAHADLSRTMGRVSSLGLWCVVLLMATGVYASLLHLTRPAELTTTPYGLALVLKLALVGIILALAGFNRWWLLPALKQGKTRRLGQMLRLEAILLLAVFAATGVLTTRPLPHG